MDFKRVGKAVLFGAAVGAATYAVRKLLPVVVDSLGYLKMAWEATKDDLESCSDIGGEEAES